MRPSAETADQIYDQISSCLASPEFKPRALYEKFKIELLATTDDPCDDLAAHQFLRDDEAWQGRVIPTFRPDKYLEPAQPTWNADVDRLAEVSGIDTGDYDGYIAAMENRRQYFKDNGAVSSDHSHFDARTDMLEVAEAQRTLRPGPERRDHARRRRPRCAATSVRDGPDGRRRRSGDDPAPGRPPQPPHPTFERTAPMSAPTFPCRWSSPMPCGRCWSASAPSRTSSWCFSPWTRRSSPGRSRPLAGFYPSVFAGAPWWFLDAPEAIPRYRARRHRDRGLRQDLRLHRRHPRLLLHPGSARHVAPA